MNFNNIPEELKRLDQWVLWRSIVKIKDKKPSKIPYQPSGVEAQTNNPDTWNSFETVNNKFSNNGKSFSGIGFVFTDNDPYIGIDFDDCVDENGDIKKDIMEWVNKFASYTEYSQSGKGIHIICRGVNPGCRRKQKGGIEIYENVRYFAFTGNIINNYKDIKNCQNEINNFYYTVFKEEEEEEKKIQSEYKNTYLPSGDKEEFYSKVLQVLRENGQGLFSNYNEFLRFCMGCKAVGIPYEEIDCILQMSDGYNPVQNKKLYEKLQPKKVDFGTVYYFANKADSYKLKELLCQKKEFAVANFSGSRQRENQLNSTIQENNKDEIKTFTLKELLAENLPPVKWLVQDILPEGLSILLGKPKIGKSFLAFNFACAIAAGSNTLGKLKTEKTGVLYFAIEDHKRRLQDRVLKMVNAMVRAGESIPDNLEFSLHMKKLQEGGMEQLKNLIDNRPELKFIIIDTLGRVRKTSSGGNAYEIDTDLIGEVQELCKAHKISILLLHHTKKIKESDYIDDCSGSTGITGSVDTILKLSRNRNEKDATLQVTGRDIIKEQELAIQFNDISLSWELLGDAEEFRMSKERKEIIDILKDGQPHKVKEISEKLGKTYNAVKFLCWKLDNEGYIYNLNGYGYVINNNNNNSFTANLANPANLANLANPANPVDKVSGLAIDTNTANPKNTSVYKEMTDKVSRVSKVSDSSQLEDNFNREEVPF